MESRRLSVLLVALLASCSAWRDDADVPAIAFANEPQRGTGFVRLFQEAAPLMGL